MVFVWRAFFFFNHCGELVLNTDVTVMVSLCRYKWRGLGCHTATPCFSLCACGGAGAVGTRREGWGLPHRRTEHPLPFPTPAWRMPVVLFTVPFTGPSIVPVLAQLQRTNAEAHRSLTVASPCSRGGLHSPRSAGNTTQQRRNCPGCSWSVWKTR